jgi:hypothetical protein
MRDVGEIALKVSALHIGKADSGSAINLLSFDVDDPGNSNLDRSACNSVFEQIAGKLEYFDPVQKNNYGEASSEIVRNARSYPWNVTEDVVASLHRTTINGGTIEFGDRGMLAIQTVCNEAGKRSACRNSKDPIILKGATMAFQSGSIVRLLHPEGEGWNLRIHLNLAKAAGGTVNAGSLVSESFEDGNGTKLCKTYPGIG